jgi:linoleoyl-CoA desaturase
MSKVKFSSRPDFFHILRKRTDEYFQQNNLKKTGDFRLYSKTIILFTSLITLYVWLVFFTPQYAAVSLLLCAIMGVNLAAIGFNVMHDGAHGSYSSNPTINNIMGFALNIMGGNVYIWKLKHNGNHHTYTNVDGHDDDIDIKPFLRVHKGQPKKFIHNYQHFYGIFLYGLTYFFWVYYNDFYKYFRSKVADHTPLKKMSLKDHVYFWFSKVLYTFVFIVFPITQVGLLPLIIGYATMVAVCGIVIAVVFQLAHVVEDTEFVTPKNEVEQIENEWAVHQLHTTVNFATKSKFLNWLLGGLNFQVEHHLFPSISHVHYPELNKIVKETCQEYNVKYKEYKTFVQAIHSHFAHLKKVGQMAA